MAPLFPLTLPSKEHNDIPLPPYIHPESPAYDLAVMDIRCHGIQSSLGRRASSLDSEL